MIMGTSDEQIRRQLTLFLSEQCETIEKIRARYNPIQQALIAAHVTLCRENEIQKTDEVIRNIQAIVRDKPVRIEFSPVERFHDGKGVLLPGKIYNNEFYELRKLVLKRLDDFPSKPLAHITLMHPRNSTCTDEIFEKISAYELPTAIDFDTISLIEQRNDQPWRVLEQFRIVKHIP
jgi:2'-5' RNA ligase